MSEKRRDNKNRILQTGESQRNDGRYCYKYIDNCGKPQFIYSWKLISTDRLPKGKRDDISLREKEKQIQRDLEEGIDTSGKKMTVYELYEKYIYTHGNVKISTKKGRERLLKRLKNDKLGQSQIGTIKPTDAVEWAVRQKANGYSYKSIKNDKRSLSAIFQMAVQNDYIRKNPFRFQLNTVIEDDADKREPLSPEQEKGLLEFLQSDNTYKKYYDEFMILLGTGLRISEFCGLTVKDIDLESRKIIVDHQLLKHTGKGLYIDKPKTKSGIREIPMSSGVYDAFERVLKKHRDSNVVIDGYSNFLFCARTGYPRTSAAIDYMFNRLSQKYNACHKEPLPDIFTPHVLRHTFCTNMANAGMNPKTLQYIMGHGSIMMTLDFYTHASFTSAKEEIERLSA